MENNYTHNGNSHIPPHMQGNQEEKVQAEVVNKNIPIDGVNLPESDVEVVNDDLKAPSVGELIHDGSIGIFEYIMEFEEEHPWIFFVGIALTLFLIIGGISSFIFDMGSAVDKIKQTSSGIYQTITGNKEGSTSESGTEPEAPVFKAPYKAANQGIISALVDSTLEGYDKLIYKTDNGVFLADEMSLMKDFNKSLTVDIQAELTTIQTPEDRLEHLKQYLIGLIAVEKKGANYYIRMNQTITALTSEYATLSDEKKVAYDELNASLETKGPNETKIAMKKALEKDDKMDQTENRLLLAKQIRNAYENPLKLIQARIAAIRANKDILVSGYKVVSIQQAGIEMMQSGTVYEYYQSQAPLSGGATEKTSSSNKTNTSTTSTTSSTTTNIVQTPKTTRSSKVEIPQFINEKTLDSVMGTPFKFNENHIPNMNPTP